MFEKDEKMPASETCDTPMFNVKAGAGSKADMSAVDTLTSSTHFNFIRKLITLIEFVISFFSGEIGLTFRTLPDGTQTVFFGRKEQLSEVSVEEVQKKKKSWKDHPNAPKLQAMIDDGLLETYNTEDVEGLKIAKTFTDAKFLEYESAFGSIKGFVALADEGLLYSVSGQKLLYSTMIEYRNKHKK